MTHHGLPCWKCHFESLSLTPTELTSFFEGVQLVLCLGLLLFEDNTDQLFDLQIRMLGEEGGKDAAGVHEHGDDVFLKKIESHLLTQASMRRPSGRSHTSVTHLPALSAMMYAFTHKTPRTDKCTHVSSAMCTPQREQTFVAYICFYSYTNLPVTMLSRCEAVCSLPSHYQADTWLRHVP